MSEKDDDTTEDRDRRYAEVSLRAVELLARAQRTADEAVAEAQAYARDLEATARAQYAQILQRAQVAARELAESRSAGADAQDQPGSPAGSMAIVEQVEYVRTYARVAHAQLKAVLTALTDELDHLAAVAAGRSEFDATDPPGPSIEASWPSPPEKAPDVVPADQESESPTPPEPSNDVDDAPDGEESASSPAAPAPDGAPARAGHRGARWPAAPEERSLSGAQPATWRNSFQRGS